MKLNNKIYLLIVGALLAFAGINLVINSDAVIKTGAAIAITGVLTDIIVLITMIRNDVARTKRSQLLKS